MWKLLTRLFYRNHAPKAPPPQPRHARRRDPHEPLHYDDPSKHYTPIEQWLHGLDEPRPRNQNKSDPTADEHRRTGGDSPDNDTD